MKIYSTASKKKEEFVPINDKKVKFFVCGPTVYDLSHLGHAKTYTQFDFVVKYLRWRGYEVEYLQNITDIDDKIIKRSAEKGRNWQDLAREYEGKYMEDMKSLHNTAVSKYARATEFIDQIVGQVKVLLDKGFAYRISDGIYFEVSKFGDYGKLSGRRELQAEDSVSRIDENKEKRGWNDFCLWKLSKPGEPVWKTELGDGRPGWHIEDTAITETIFGQQYDIHGGAVDLIFPHHEAEIAQMEGASGKKPLVRYWMHTGFLNINSEKMSKSKGNFKSIRDVLGTYEYRVVRYLFLSSHYRSEMDFSDLTMDKASLALRRIDDFLGSIDPRFDDSNDKEILENLRERVVAALDDDFNTPMAFGAIFDFIRKKNAAGGVGKNTIIMFKELDKFFDFFKFERGIEEIPEEIKDLAAKRKQAREAKNWAESDRLRDEIKARGYVVEDLENDCKIRKLMLS